MNKFQSIIFISILIVLAETSSTRRSKKPPTKPAHLTTVTTPTRKVETKLPTARTTELPSTVHSTEALSSEDTSMATASFLKGIPRSKNPKHPKAGPIVDPPINYDYEEYENTQEKDEKNSDDTKFEEKDDNEARWNCFELVFVVLLVMKLL